jgi:hypothetical protein
MRRHVQRTCCFFWTQTTGAVFYLVEQKIQEVIMMENIKQMTNIDENKDTAGHSLPGQKIPPIMDQGEYILDEDQSFPGQRVILGDIHPNNKLTITENHTLAGKEFTIGAHYGSDNNSAQINSGSSMIWDFGMEVGPGGSHNSITFLAGAKCVSPNLIIGPGVASIKEATENNTLTLVGEGTTCDVRTRIEVSGKGSNLRVLNGAVLKTSEHINAFVGGCDSNKVYVMNGTWVSDGNIFITGTDGTQSKNSIVSCLNGKLEFQKNLYLDGGRENHMMVARNGYAHI